MAESTNSEIEFDDSDSVLAEMKSEDVFEAVVSEDRKTITFTDRCDGMFWMRLDKREMLMLIYELQSLAESMVD